MPMPQVNKYAGAYRKALAENPGADVLLTYNLSWLAQDENLFKLLR